MMALGWITVICAVLFVVAGLVVALTFDTGPDWLHSVCLVALYTSSAVGVVSVVLLAGAAIGIDLSFSIGGEA
jgi:hypothetical protein